MLSLSRCEEILNKETKKYSKAEISIIREQLTKLSLIDYEHFQEKQQTKKSCHLHKGLDGRTSSSRV